jgi:hypothetical protein
MCDDGGFGWTIRAVLIAVSLLSPGHHRALERACKELEISADDERRRRIIATRIVDRAVIDADALARRVIAEGTLST